jgi:tRNA (mo5U34)-methyltransferase
MWDLFSSPLDVSPRHRADLANYISNQSDWFHTFDFGQGLLTPGRDPSAQKLHHLCLPSNLNGLTVLDVGAYDGYFSFHCEKRGAQVVATDKFVWDWPGNATLKNFQTIHSALESKLDVVRAGVDELPASLNGKKFDVVLFLGVLYHAPDMVQYLKSISAVTKGVCVLETYLDGLDLEGAQATLYAEKELNNDSSNWWGPNLQATATMLRRVGFRAINFMNLWNVNTKNALAGKSWEGPVRTGRAVLHAYK